MPKIVIAQRVIDSIVQAALRHPNRETGEAMIGLLMPQADRSEPDIYVLDTIHPAEDTAVREEYMFEQGDDWQGDVFNWLHYNWEAFRELRRPSYGSAVAAKWDVPLSFLGDWHKQPGDMIEPSGGDVAQARAMIDDPETPEQLVVAPIITLYRLAALEESEPTLAEEIQAAVETPPPPPANAVIREVPEKGWRVRIDFWYMSRHTRLRFAPLEPDVWANARLPLLPPLAWHLAQPRRFEQELSLLLEAGYQVDTVRWDADGRPPFEICFSVYKPGSTQVVLLVTSAADYPRSRPAARLAPLVPVGEDEDVFEKLYGASRPVLDSQMPPWEWDSKRTLVELVWHIEKEGQA